MFYMQDAAFSIFGASPESALKYERESNQVEIYPIAGTRPRGKRPDGSPPSRATTSKSRNTPEQIAALRKRQEAARKGRSAPTATSRYTEAQMAEYRKRMAERYSGTTGPVAPSLPPGMVAGELGMLLYKGP